MLSRLLPKEPSTKPSIKRKGPSDELSWNEKLNDLSTSTGSTKLADQIAGLIF
jgi:hypothetical protein